MSKTDFDRLSEPFDSSVVKSITKTIRGEQVELSNVAPAHYIERLLEHAPTANIKLGDPIVVLDSSIAVKCSIEIDGVVKEGLGAEPIHSTEPDDVSFSVKSAASDALKIAATKFGMGLELYLGREVKRDAPPARTQQRPAPQNQQDEYEPEAPAPRQQQAPRANSGGGRGAPWTGELEVKYGQNAGTKFKDLYGESIEWYINRDGADPSKAGDQMHAKEKQRRIDAGTWDPKEKAPYQGKGGGTRNAVKRNLADL